MKRLGKRKIKIKKANFQKFRDDISAILKNCIESLYNKVSSLVKEMNPFDNSAEEINSEAYNVAYEELYEEPTVDNIAKTNKMTKDDVVLYTLSHFGETLINKLEQAYTENLDDNYNYQTAGIKKIVKKANNDDILLKVMQIFNELDSKTEEFEKSLKMLPQDTPERRDKRMEMIKAVHEIYNSLDVIKYDLYNKK